MTETFETWREVEFRDGISEVPAWMADLMAGLATHTMTKEEAIVAANRQMQQRVISNAYDDVVKEHFGGTR
jgi:hypothetical protein